MDKVRGFLTFVWNPKQKEFLGRDGASWAKISLFYFIFYLILAGFFIGMLAIFRLTLDDHKPSYYGKSSTMNIARSYETNTAGVNPALGFRPQLDPEAALIMYSKSKLEDPAAPGDFARLNRSLELFLQNYYDYEADPQLEVENCASRDLQIVRDELRLKKHCSFNYEKLLEALQSPSKEDPFGYNTNGPVVLLKLNRIYDWLPKAYDFESLPGWLQKIKEKTTDPNKLAKLRKLVGENVIVRCTGEYASDMDAVSRHDLTYHSIDDDAQEFNREFGVLPFYYYPYLNQKNYESPLIFTQFNAVRQNQTNVLTNVVCRAYAANIDSDDKLNRRGMTIFQLYVKN